jgi:MFS family permease
VSNGLHVSGFETLLGENAQAVRDRSFQVLLLANLTSPLGPALVSPLLDTLTGVYGVSEAEIGLLIAAYTAPGIFVIPVVGVLADRYGRKPLLAAGLLLFGCAGVALSLTTDFRAVLALRVLQGVGGAAIVPVIITSIGDLYVGATEATAQGLRLSTSGLTQAVFPAIAGVLVVLAWQYPLLLYAIAVPIAIVVLVRLEEPRGARSDGGRDVEGHDSGAGVETGRDGADGNESGNASDGAASLLRLAVRRPVLAVLAGRGIPGFCYFGFITYNSIVVVRVLGGSPAQAGLLVTLGSVSYAVSASQAGRVTARFRSRRPPMIGMFLALGAGLGVVAVAPSVLLSGVGVVLLGVGFGTLGSLYRSIVTGIAPESLRGGLVSISESVGRVGITVVPVVMGLLVAALTPAVGLETAVRLTLVAVGVASAVAGIGSVLLGDVDPRATG